jgi:hypothetical protein
VAKGIIFVKEKKFLVLGLEYWVFGFLSYKIQMIAKKNNERRTGSGILLPLPDIDHLTKRWIEFDSIGYNP